MSVIPSKPENRKYKCPSYHSHGFDVCMAKLKSLEFYMGRKFISKIGKNCIKSEVDSTICMFCSVIISNSTFIGLR